MKPWVKGLLAVLVFGLVMGALWWRYSEFLTQGMRPSEGTLKLNQMEKGGVPDFTLTDLSDKKVHLADYKDKIVILSFWASWCDPCIAEFPSMLKLVEHFKGEVVLVAVSADSSLDDINSFLKSVSGFKENVVILWDKAREVAKQYGTEALPESYILGRNLKLIRKVAGSEDWYTPEAVHFFEQIVQGKF